MNVHVITGGSSGIGKEAAFSLKEGKVVITARRENLLQEAVKELKEAGIDAVYKSCDISKPDQVRALFEFAEGFGEVKTLINSAGVSGVGMDPKKTFEIDLVGTENILEVAMEYMNDGVIVLISSMMGHTVPPEKDRDQYLMNSKEDGNIDKLVELANGKSDVAYNFSKRGVQLLVQKYAEVFGKKGGRIVSISPGVIMTPMAEKAAEEHPEQMEFLKSMTPAGRNGKPEDIVNAINFLISNQASFITGGDLKVDGGLSLNLGKLAKLKK
ncbi:MAG: SDR family oxidoreductase [Tissierellia bacterium]|nr:SDR family oxidoreductase [Tissierellia bacterium]